jgi:hypothetical protein
LLYDLGADPGEQHNLAEAAEHRPRLEAMRQRRRAWVENLESWTADQPWQEPVAGDV